MPYINVKTTEKISAEKETALKARMGSAIESIPGKNEKWLMCEFEDGCHLWLGGTNDAPTAFVQVKIFGKAHREAYERMSAALCQILDDEMGISPDRVYITYSEYADWGWNGSNF